MTFVAALIACGVYTRLAKSWQILDRPNERSSHREPTPHGGGVPLFLAVALGFTLSPAWAFELSWLFSASIFLMLVGVFDDMRGLSVSTRFLLYTLVSLSSAAVLLHDNLAPLKLMWLSQWVCLSFAIIWALNLYNFMDGIDGIAATQCILACLVAAFFANSDTEASSYSLFCLILAAGSLGFLVWNWSPARLFLGDAGSIPLGFLLAGLAGYGAVQGYVSFAVWSVLLAVFIGDASWTLTARLLSSQNITQAHNQHSYQRLSRHWGSHQRVVILLGVFYLFWLFPIAWLLHQSQDNGVYLVILAYIPVALGMAKINKLT